MNKNNINNRFNYIVLLLGGLLFFGNVSLSYGQKPYYSDVFLFRIVDTVYSLNEVKSIHKDLKTLKCIYPESLLKDVFKGVISRGEDQSIFKVKDYSKEKYSAVQITFFKKLIRFAKLKSYIQSHKVKLSPGLEGLFYQAAVKNKCSMQVFGVDKKFAPNFFKLVRMEIFLRSRYILDDKKKNGGQSGAQGVNALIKSIENQISEEVYW